MTLKGRHVALMFVSGFSVIIAVNIALAVNAVRTFPGLEVPNSYVASQAFEARRQEQQALGWTSHIAYDEGTLSVDLFDAHGARIAPRRLDVHVARPTETKPEALAIQADGTAPLSLAPGLWRVDLAAHADDGTLFQRQAILTVPE